jgi:hypothetical protein
MSRLSLHSPHLIGLALAIVAAIAAYSIHQGGSENSSQASSGRRLAVQPVESGPSHSKAARPGAKKRSPRRARRGAGADTRQSTGVPAAQFAALRRPVPRSPTTAVGDAPRSVPTRPRTGPVAPRRAPKPAPRRERRPADPKPAPAPKAPVPLPAPKSPAPVAAPTSPSPAPTTATPPQADSSPPAAPTATPTPPPPAPDTGATDPEAAGDDTGLGPLDTTELGGPVDETPSPPSG